MRKTVLQSFKNYFISTSGVAYAILWFPLGRRGPVESTPEHEPLWSPDLWGRVLWALGRDLWEQAPIALPVGFTGAGVIVGLPVLAEEQGWCRADTLMPGEYVYAGAESPSPEEPSEIWHVYDTIRNWAPPLSLLLGLCAGIGLFVWFYLAVSTSASLLLGLGFAALIAGIVAVAAIGWCITAVLLLRK